MQVLRSALRNRNQWLSTGRSLVSFSTQSAGGSGDGGDKKTPDPTSSIAERMLKEHRSRQPPPYPDAPGRERPSARYRQRAGDSSSQEPRQRGPRGDQARGRRRQNFRQYQDEDEDDGRPSPAMLRMKEREMERAATAKAAREKQNAVVGRGAPTSLLQPLGEDEEFEGPFGENYDVKQFNHLLMMQEEKEFMFGPDEIGGAPVAWEDFKKMEKVEPGKLLDQLKHILIATSPEQQALMAQMSDLEEKSDAKLKKEFDAEFQTGAPDSSSSSASDSSTSSSESSSDEDEKAAENLMENINGFFHDEREFQEVKKQVEEHWAIWEQEWEAEQKKQGKSTFANVKEEEEAFMKEFEADLSDDHSMKEFVEMAKKTILDNRTYSYEKKREAMNALFKGL